MTQTEPATSDYIRPVDGLRAVAILSVVAYHVGLPLPGGFVGVDVFFVISGFLIIGQIVAGLQKSSFRFSDFWGRRALRILPPYLLVILASMAIAPFVLVTSAEFGAFKDEVIWSAGMAVNQLFLSQQDYFDAVAETKPLLHLWSLAVEEQFYLLAPLLLFGFWFCLRRIGRPAARMVFAAGTIGVLFLASLALCILFTGGTDDKNYAFYLAPLRAWEFMLGGLVGVAVPRLARLPKWVLEVLAMAGLAAIALAALAFTSLTPFPSYRALLPAGGAALFILAARGHPNAIAARLLALRPMTFIGLVSYSWYLWHWPLLTFGRIYHFGQQVLLWDIALGAVLPFLLAVATYFLLERPIRRWRQKGRLTIRWPAVGIGIAACLCVAALGTSFSPRPLAAEAVGAADPLSFSCRLDQPRLPKCYSTGSPHGLVIGDSFSKAVFPVLARSAAEKHVALALVPFNGCSPFLNTIVFSKGADRNKLCRRQSQQTVANLKRTKIDFAIISALWAAHLEGMGPAGSTAPAKDQKKLFQAKFGELVKALTDAGATRILVIGQTPQFAADIPECVARSIKYGIDLDRHCSVKRASYERYRKKAVLALTQAIGSASGVVQLDPENAFCDQSLCHGAAGTLGLFADNHHPSDAGTERLVSANPAAFNWVFGH